MRLAACLAATVSLAALTGCSSPFGGDDAGRSAFSLEPGQCVVPPKEPTTTVADVDVVPCADPHTQEVFAVVGYRSDTGAAVSDFPGGKALTSFAEGSCAEKYEGYVGVPYPDSDLFFTYLLPSARSWEQGRDRDVVCLVTTTGEALRASVKGSKR